MNPLLEFVERFGWKSKPLTLGQRGERAAANFLRRNRYQIIATGERSRSAELDIVAVDRKDGRRTIVFVEVKTRTSTNKGHPAEAVDEGKQIRITRGAESFIRKYDLAGNPFRFDIISVVWPDASKKPQIEHFMAAFEAVTGEWD